MRFSPRRVGLVVGCLVLFFLHAAAVVFIGRTPDIGYAVPSSLIAPESGHAFVIQVIARPRTLYVLPTDTLEDLEASKLTIFENGNPLGPPHSPHSDVRARGMGRFSHWGMQVLFSTSDGTDPRANGRTYSIESPTRVRPALKAILWIALFLADLFYLRAIKSTFIRYGEAVAIVGAVLTVIAMGLAALGMLGKIYLANGQLPSDWDLLALVGQHAVLGCIVSIGTWAAGAGVVHTLLRKRHASMSEVLIPAYPTALLILAGLVALALVVPGGRTASLILWAMCVLPLLRWRPPAEELRQFIRVIVLVLPFALVFGSWLALLWHGPTDKLPGSPSGDLGFYASITWTLADRAYPFVDLGYELANGRSYFNSLFPALGAVLINLPNFDALLFLLASGGAAYVLLTAVMLHLLLTDCAPSRRGLLRTLILTITFVAAARYPYWISESIPVIFVPALTLSVWWMAERGQARGVWSIAAMLAGFLGSVVSKVVTAPILALLGATALWRLYRPTSRRAQVIGMTIAVLLAAYCVAMLWHYLPLFAKIATVGPESAISPNISHVLRDLGVVCLTVAAWILLEPLVAAVLTLALATHFLFSFVFQINFIVATLVIGIAAATKEGASFLRQLFAVAALTLCLPAAILSDPAGVSSGIAWLACVGGSVALVSLRSNEIFLPKPRLSLPTIRVLRCAKLAIAALALISIGNGVVIISSGWDRPLSPQLRDVWLAARKLTPQTSLIFTDQVDETPSIAGGWNTYAFIGQRQVYLSSYYTEFELRTSKDKLRDLLATNDAVLSGTKNPMEVTTRARYNEMFAVVSSRRAVPRSWNKLYDNGAYAIFRIL